MMKENQTTSSSFFPLPSLNPLLRSFNIPAPVIYPPGTDPNTFLNPNSNGDDKMEQMPPFDVDPCVASRNEIITRTTDLTASEHAGGSLTEPSMAAMDSDSPVNSDTSAPQIVNDLLMAPNSPANSETDTPMIVNDVMETKYESKTWQIIRCDVCNVMCNSEEVLKEHKAGKQHLKNMQKLSVLSPIMQETSPEVGNAVLHQESKKKLEDFIQIEASVESLFVCNIPDLNRKTEHPHGEKHEAQETSGPLVQTSNSGTQKEQYELNVGHIVWCEVCKVTISGKQNLQTHNLRKNHLKNLKLSEQIRTPPLTTPTSTAITPITTPMEKIGDSVENPELTKGEVVNPKEGSSHRCELCGIHCSSSSELNNHISGKKHKKNVHKTENLNGHVVAPVTEKMLQDMKDEGGRVVILETGKRKADDSLVSEEEVDAKRKKVVTEGGVSGGAPISCKIIRYARWLVLA